MEHLHHDHAQHMGMGDGGMDHGGHGGGGMDMGGKCSMNMLWNTQIIDTCIVFPSWHIRTHFHFFVSFLAIVALGVLYEWLRAFARNVDRRIARGLARGGKGKANAVGASGRVSPNESGRGRSPSPSTEDSGLLTGHRVFKAASYPVPPVDRVVRATVYGALVFLSFFLMLVFMTYNAYLIFAVVLGAGIGHFALGGVMDVDAVLGAGADGKAMTCH